MDSKFRILYLKQVGVEADMPYFVLAGTQGFATPAVEWTFFCVFIFV